jgi:membrane protease YdiL (CAAX protease family)
LSKAQDSPTPSLISNDPRWLRKLVNSYPEAPFVLPFFAFLLLMLLDRAFPPEYRTYTYAIRAFGALYVAWLFRRHFPPLGKLHLHLAIAIGLGTMIVWVALHHFFAGCSHQPCRLLGLFGFDHHWQGVGWYTKWLMFDGKAEEYFNPHEYYKSPLALWSFLVIRIGGASITVPIVEELFWRAFVLRILIDWHKFEDVPLGKFTLFSFLVSSLLSAVQHQPQWEVGILCWFIYNAVFYWKKSLLLCMVTHGITNFALYAYVYHAQDWRFW